MIWLDRHQLRVHANHNNHIVTLYAREHNSTHTENQNQQLQLIMQSHGEKSLEFLTLFDITFRVLEVNNPKNKM